jgi:predicted phosphodiesterase
MKIVGGLALLVILLSYSAAYAEAEGAARPMRFAVIGDRTGSHDPGIHSEMLKEIERMKPDFVVGVGDMIEGYSNDTTAVKAEWKEYMELVEALSMPIYFTPGNHDIWDSTSLGVYERIVGTPYYSFDIGNAHFIVLDTSRWFEVDDFPQDQIDWLKGDLASNRDAARTFVVFHVPYWIETVSKGEPDRLHDLFVAHGVDAVFTGHYHVYFSGEYDGILYTGVGSSGGGCDPGITGLKYHFVWVTVDGDEISLAPIKMGSVLPWEEVTAETFHFVEKIQREAIDIEKVPFGTDVAVAPTRVTVTLRNLSEESSLKGTLEWDIPRAWNVSPRSLPVEVAPLESHTATFSVGTEGPIYPAPTLSIQYPCEDELEINVEKALPIERTVYAYKAGTPPVIDGELEMEVYRDPTVVFFAPDGSAMTTDSVAFYFAWDEDNFYIAARCIESKVDAIVAAATNHDDAIYGEDCVGYFLQPEMPNGPVYQIYFNPLGTAFDQKILVEEGAYSDAEPEWNGSYEVKTSRGRDHWSIEARIPLAQLETRGAYEKTWALNFRRKQRRLETSADWQVPISYSPGDYGILIMR